MDPLTTNDAKYGSVRAIDFAPAVQVSLPSTCGPSSSWSLEEFEQLKVPDTPVTVGDAATLDDPDAD